MTQGPLIVRPIFRLLSTSCLSLLTAPLLLHPAAAAQGRQTPTLYEPRAIKLTYQRGTRLPDGAPGPNYWENHAQYRIDIAVAPPDPTVHGSEQLVYHNNSPDTLRTLVIKLFMNVHKPGAPRMGGAAPDYLNSGVQIDSFAVNGQPQQWGSDARVFTWKVARLPTPLLPHDSVRLAFTWHYDLVQGGGREGIIDTTTDYLAYFYPRVAVYDDYNGWDTMDFTGSQEFYSDFNDYDVTFTVPENFVVWGTGTLTDAADVLQPAPLARFKASFTSDTTIHVATGAATRAGETTTQQPTNRWHFTASNVPDMAFGVSDHYDWDAASVSVDNAAGRRASTQAAYNDDARDYHYMVQFARSALDFLSHQWPGVPYPYEKTTIFRGFADMEYPMMVNDNSNADSSFSRFVVAHELAHTYFPFYMGINETRYGFMDEGWATTFEYLINQRDMGKAAAERLYQQFRVARWANDPSPLEDLPIITPEDVLKGVAYGNNAYGKASLGYLAVKDLLGDAGFRKSLHAFMDRWHGKHPIPWDFFYTFDNVSGQNLDWFWKDWYFSDDYIDLAITGVTHTSRGYAVAVRNIGGMDAPFDLILKYSDGSSDSLHQTPMVWKADQTHTTIIVPTSKTLTSAVIDGGIWMDADVSNNRWNR
jgi:Peptidase family M1 domain